MGRRLLFYFALFLFLLGCSQMAMKKAQMQTPKVPKGAEYVGTSACYDCHEEMKTDGQTNVHLRLASFEVKGAHTGCEGCHGPGSLHVEGDGDTAKIIRFGKGGISSSEVAGVCLTCHKKDETGMRWPFSIHARRGLSCTKCHKVHGNANKALLRFASEEQICASCHQDVIDETYLPSHHPVKEKHMGCADCHNPHGSSGAQKGMLKNDGRVNDLCINCHTRYQGPFVFEHPPASENCLLCHNPHGTVANSLLKENEPFLCLQCHEEHFHAARAADPSYGPHDGWQRGFMTKCTQCHQNIHGSDLPSQTGGGGGKAFTR